MRRLSPKQQTVIDHLSKHPTMTLSDAVELIGRDVYANKRFHVGCVLTRMIKRKLIVRLKRNCYALARENPQNLDQLPLWKGNLKTIGTGPTATES
jgi:hypothetical protein